MSAADDFPEIARLPQGIGCLVLEDCEDCCDCEYPSVEVYPTEDDDVVTLCSSCVDELRSMVAGTEMADAFDSETEPLDEGSAP